MKKPAYLFLLLILSYSQTPPAMSGEAAATSVGTTSVRARTVFAVSTNGEPFGLRLEDGMLAFCDKRGGRKLDLKTGQDNALDRTCPNNDDPNTSCGGLNLDVAIKAQFSEPNDVVDFDGSSIFLKGRVHDCAADGGVLAIVTASTVILLDVIKKATKEISHEGGDHVAINPKWVAWSKDSKLRVAPRGD